MQNEVNPDDLIYSDNEEIAENTPKSKKKFVLIVVLVLIFALIVSIGALLFSQLSNLKAIRYSFYSSSDLDKKAEEIAKRKNDVIKKITDTVFYELSENERINLSNGQLSENEALRIISGNNSEKTSSKSGQSSNSNSSTKTFGKDDLTPSGNGSDQKSTNDAYLKPTIDNLIARIYLLKADFLNQIDTYIAQAKEDYLKLDDDAMAKLDIANTYIEKGNALEASCDERMDVLLLELETALKDNNKDTKVISEIKKVYTEEKALKKSELFSRYYKK